MPKKSTLIANLHISAPAGAKKRKPAKKKVTGGFIPAPLAIGLLGALGAPIAQRAGQEIVKGIEYGVRKLRGKGVVRTGAVRRTGGRVAKH